MSNQTIDEILRKVDIHKSIAFPDGNPFRPGNISVEEAAAAIQKLIAEVIGEDEPAPAIPQNDYYWRFRNELRAKQRQRAKERGLL